jgi:hypothetical protein
MTNDPQKAHQLFNDPEHVVSLVVPPSSMEVVAELMCALFEADSHPSCSLCEIL